MSNILTNLPHIKWCNVTYEYGNLIESKCGRQLGVICILLGMVKWKTLNDFINRKALNDKQSFTQRKITRMKFCKGWLLERIESSIHFIHIVKYENTAQWTHMKTRIKIDIYYNFDVVVYERLWGILIYILLNGKKLVKLQIFAYIKLRNISP